MNKRGSHIDVIISFIIFISFIVFAYAILQPTLTTQEGKTSLASSLDTALANNLSGNLTTISLAISQTSQANCIQLKDFFNNVISNPTITVGNSTGFVFPIYDSGGDLYIDTSSNPQLNLIFDIYYSPAFNPIQTSGMPSGCNALQQGSLQNNYVIGQISSSTQYIFDFNVIQLIDNYNSNYNSVKNWFNISAQDNFGFNFTYQNLTTIGTNSKVPGFTNVYSQAFPVSYLTSNNSLQSGLLTVRVW